MFVDGFTNKKELLLDKKLYKIIKGCLPTTPNLQFVNLKSNTIMKKPQCKGIALLYYVQVFFHNKS